MVKESRVDRLTRYLPIVDWLPHYKPEWLRFDIIAALSVWALLVPQSIAYGSIAGVPLQFGLYAALGALVGYALFGTAGQVIGWEERFSRFVLLSYWLPHPQGV